MNYTCPSCKASWTLGDKLFRGGTPFTCGGCSHTSTIPLYCPECSPPGSASKTFLQTPSGPLGGETFVCPRKHTFTVPVAHGEAVARIKSMGVASGFKPYQQSARIEGLTDDTLKKTVKGGYCAGVVLDWIRRALLGGKTMFADESPRQDRRAAVAWMEQSKDKKKSVLARELDAINAHTAREFSARQIEINAAADRQTDEAFADLNRRVAEYAKQQGITQQMYDELRAVARATYELKLEQIDANRKKSVGAVKASIEAEAAAKANRPVMTQFWAEFATRMDAVLAADRLARKKSGSSARPFSNLVIAGAVDEREFPGIPALIKAAVNDNAFAETCAAYVGVRPPVKGATGHAIGILRLNTGDRYVLFDPNFGTFDLSGAKLQEAVTFLFRKAYPHGLGAVGSDAHVYEINGKVNGEYTIFVSPRPSPHAVAPSQPATSAAAAAAAAVPVAPRVDRPVGVRQ